MFTKILVTPLIWCNSKQGSTPQNRSSFIKCKTLCSYTAALRHMLQQTCWFSVTQECIWIQISPKTSSSRKKLKPSLKKLKIPCWHIKINSCFKRSCSSVRFGQILLKPCVILCDIGRSKMCALWVGVLDYYQLQPHTI